MSTNQLSSWDTSLKWPEMSAAQKTSFIVKLVIALATFGFVFPNLMD